jgi:hypothetical protein
MTQYISRLPPNALALDGQRAPSLSSRSVHISSMSAECFLGRELLATLWAVNDGYFTCAVACVASDCIVPRLGWDNTGSSARCTGHWFFLASSPFNPVLFLTGLASIVSPGFRICTSRLFFGLGPECRPRRVAAVCLSAMQANGQLMSANARFLQLILGTRFIQSQTEVNSFGDETLPLSGRQAAHETGAECEWWPVHSK